MNNEPKLKVEGVDDSSSDDDRSSIVYHMPDPDDLPSDNDEHHHIMDTPPVDDIPLPPVAPVVDGPPKGSQKKPKKGKTGKKNPGINKAPKKNNKTGSFKDEKVLLSLLSDFLIYKNNVQQVGNMSGKPIGYIPVMQMGKF